MYNGVGLMKGLSLTKIIGGISKTLQIANQVIPLYQKAKPMISNARSILSVLKTIEKKPQQLTTSTNNTQKIEQNTPIKKEETTMSPTFFL